MSFRTLIENKKEMNKRPGLKYPISTIEEIADKIDNWYSNNESIRSITYSDKYHGLLDCHLNYAKVYWLDSIRTESEPSTLQRDLKYLDKYYIDNYGAPEEDLPECRTIGEKLFKDIFRTYDLSSNYKFFD